MSLFAYDFMIRATIGALVVGLAAPALGVYLVQRRMSLIGDGIGHIALTGVGVGLLMNRSPVVAAVIVAALGAVGIELVRERGKTSGDIALAVLFYGGIAGGVVLVGLSSDRSSANLMAYLFGSLLSTSRQDLVVITALSVGVLAVTLLLRPWLFAVCHDEEYARVAGLPVRALNLTLAVTTAVTVTVAMRAVGLLLVSALMVVPVATVQQVTRGFHATMYGAMAVGLAAAAGGVVVSAHYDTAPGASIVLLAIGVFFVVALSTGVRNALRRRFGIAHVRRPAPAPVPVPAEAGVEPPDVVLDR